MTKKVSKQDIINHFESEGGSPEETNDFIHRFELYGFCDDVPSEAANYLHNWADADPGDEAEYYAESALDILMGE